MKIRLAKIAFILIFLLAVFLRFYKLNNIPDGFFIDESAIGYNAYSILKTGRDEWGHFLPLYFKSVGDFKLPVYFYLTIPFILIFGLNEFSVRFLSALAGSLTVLLTYFLAYFLASKILKQKRAVWVAIFSALFLTFEPWHLHFSRIALEANLSLLFVCLGFYLLLRVNKLRSARTAMAYFFLILSFFTYLAPRLFVPLLSLLLAFFYKRERKKWAINFLIFIFLFLTVFLDSKTMSRMKGISIFHPLVRQGIEGVIYEKIDEYGKYNIFLRLIHNKVIEYPLKIIYQYLNHFSPDFLFFEGDSYDLRFSIPFNGNFLLFELPFFLVGLYFLLKKKQFFLPLWFFCGPFPSALSFISPSSVRSIFMMPAFQIMSAFGLVFFFSQLPKRKLFRKGLIFIAAVLFLTNLIYFLDNYFIHQLVHRPYYWNYDFKRVALKIKELESNYDEIIIGEEGATCSHLLFFQKIEPANIWKKIEHREADDFGFEPPKRLDKYYFNPQCPFGDIAKEKVLYVCKNEVTTENYNILDKFYYKDGHLNFVFFERKRK